MDKPELVLRVDKVLIHCVLGANLMLCKEVTHHVVKETHSRSLEVTTEGPIERKRKTGIEWSLPDFLLFLLENWQILQDEALHHAAEVDDELDVHALQGLVLSIEVKLCQSFVDV